MSVNCHEACWEESRITYFCLQGDEIYMYGLLDCNNFYASCERVFRPNLNGKPVIVLSNNDGCVIARSNEAKALGIKMGVPAFEIRDIVAKHHVHVFSTNFPLYGDMSARVMNLLTRFTPGIEVYSIDEAFLDLSEMKYFDLPKYTKELVKVIHRSTGIPVSLGIADTKTLAKVANKFAKKHKAYEGVCIIDSEYKRKRALQLTQIEDVWGIGRKLSEKLKQIGVYTAFSFSNLHREWVRKNMTVTGERTWRELNGEPCIELEMIPPKKKQICTSRSFGDMITNKVALSEAISTFAANCAEKLREQKSCAVSLMVFIHTNNFREDMPQYYRNCVITLPTPTSSTIEIVRHAQEALNKIFMDGYAYKKGGVIITEITSENIQLNLFHQIDREKHNRMMHTLDKLNDHFYRNKVYLAAMGTGGTWKLKQEHFSQRYTTRLDEIITVKI